MMTLRDTIQDFQAGGASKDPRDVYLAEFFKRWDQQIDLEIIEAIAQPENPPRR